MHGAFDVDALVEGGFQQAWPHPGPRREVDDLVEPGAVKQFFQAGGVGDVALRECERLAGLPHLAKIAPLDGDVVKGIQVVQRPNGVARLQQPLANVRPDKARAARNQKIHRAKIISKI